MKYFNFLILFFPLIKFQMEGKYERHIQRCGGLQGTDYKWNLDIKENSAFTFQIISKKNVSPSKPKHLFISGEWQSSSDTLKLYNWGNKAEVIVFLNTDNKLIYQRALSTYKTDQLIYLDYLKRPTLVN